MSTLLEYRTAIQARGYATDTATAQTEAVNAARRDILTQRRWTFQATSTNFTAVVGTATISLASITPTQLDTARMLLGTEYDDLEYLRPEDLRRLSHLDRTNGVPIYWTHYGSTLMLHPRPQSAYTITVDHFPGPTDLAADGDVCVIPSQWKDVVVWGAILDLMTFRERDGGSLQAAQARYDNRLRRMISADSLDQRQTAGRVGQWSGWDRY